MKPTPIIRALCGAVVLLLPIASRAAGYNQFVGFGDSTLDSGYFRYNSTGIAASDQLIAAAVAAGAQGGYAGPGTMDSTMLAAHFGLSAEPIGHGGTNYANGGAHTVVDGPGRVSTVQQIDTYLASVRGAANPRGLYVVSTGNNDWIYTLQQGSAWNAANPDYLTGLANALAPKVAALQAAGVRTIIVPNSFARVIAAGPSPAFPPLTESDCTRLMTFNAAIWSELTQAGVNFIPADMDSVFRYVIQNPAQFGFTAESVLSRNAPSRTSALLTTSAMLSPEQERTFLFIDGAHLTTAGQRIEADYLYSLLAAPSLMALVAEGAVQNGLARTGALQTQVADTRRPRTRDGFSFWLGSGGNAIRLKNETGLPEVSTNAFSGMIGADYRTSTGVVAGAAIALGAQRQRFTAGHVDTTDGAIALYLSRSTGTWWGDAVGMAGLQRNRITRLVALGTFTDRNSADANGDTFTLAVRGGRDFRFGLASTGPFAGVDLQQVHLDGCTETGSAHVSALTFGDQTRRAAIGQLGWRVGWDVGAVRLSGRAEWNHDWSGRSRELTTTLTSVTAAPYHMEAPANASDWATAGLAVAFAVSDRAALRFDAAAVVGNPQVTSFHGGMTVSLGW